MIPSISNREVTLLRKLGQKKYRQKEQLFIVEGERAVEQVIDNGRLEIVSLYFDQEQSLWDVGEWQERSGRFPAARTDSKTFHAVSDTDTPQGVLALCNMPPEADLKELGESEGVLVAIDRIQDPGNLGTIIRTAVWFGARGILVGGGSADLFHPKVVRGTAGATGSLPFRYSELPDELDQLEKAGWEVAILASGPGAVPLSSKKPASRQVIVIGNEANGVSEQLFSEGRPVVVIKEGGENKKLVESLNASIALSIALYAVTNQASE